MKLSTILTLSAILTSTPVLADCKREANKDDQETCWYLGAGVNYSYLHPDASGSAWYVTDEYGQGVEVFAGIRFSHHWGGEFNYADIGSAGLNSRNPNIESAERITYRIPSFWLMYRLHGDETERDWDIYLRAGLGFMINKSSDSILPYEEQTTFQVPLGLGVQWTPDATWSVRLKLDSYDYDAYSTGFSLIRNF
jgi:hypothetical protein